MVVPNIFLLQGQDLSKHRWEDRLLVILVQEQNEESAKQMEKLRGHADELEVSKLKIYLFTPEQASEGLKLSESTSIHNPYSKLKSNSTNFEMLLIGLDGGIKERYSQVTDPKKIFEVIDQMPMRRAEMRKKGSY